MPHLFLFFEEPEKLSLASMFPTRFWLEIGTRRHWNLRRGHWRVLCNMTQPCDTVEYCHLLLPVLPSLWLFVFSHGGVDCDLCGNLHLIVLLPIMQWGLQMVVEIILICWFIWWIFILILCMVFHDQIKYYWICTNSFILLLYGNDLNNFFHVNRCNWIFCLFMVC